MSTTRSLYDPSAVRDPRGLGLVSDDGQALRQEIDQQEVQARDDAASAASEAAMQLPQGDETETSDIQPTESESVP